MSRSSDFKPTLGSLYQLYNVKLLPFIAFSIIYFMFAYMLVCVLIISTTLYDVSTSDVQGWVDSGVAFKATSDTFGIYFTGSDGQSVTVKSEMIQGSLLVPGSVDGLYAVLDGDSRVWVTQPVDWSYVFDKFRFVFLTIAGFALMCFTYVNQGWRVSRYESRRMFVRAEFPWHLRFCMVGSAVLSVVFLVLAIRLGIGGLTLPF